MKTYSPLKNWSRRNKILSSNGYVLVWVPEHPKSFGGGYYYEHRMVFEKKYNRILKSWETVHHISGDRTDNSPDNLFLCTRKEHDYADMD
jgi:hypothetical protein